MMPLKPLLASFIYHLLFSQLLNSPLCSCYTQQVSTRKIKIIIFLMLFIATYVFDLWGVQSEASEARNSMMRWTVNGFILSDNRVSTCSDNLLYMGGPGLQYSTGYMARTYFDLAPHDIIYFQIRILLCDNWQAKDHFSVQFDDNSPTVFSDIYKLSPSLFTVSCGSPVKNCLSIKMVGKSFHTLNSATIKVSWSFQGNPSAAFGIKDISLLFGKKTPKDVEKMYMTLGDSSLSWSTNCPSGSYYDSTTKSCGTCNSLCSLCFGPSTTECYSPSWGSSYSGSIAFSCASSCYNCWGPAINQCYWCSNVLDYDNSCKASCTSPYIAFGNAMKICLKQCASAEYMIWNNTCVSSCSFPLQSGTITQGNTCSYPCGLSNSIYLYWNGSCLPTCPYLSRIENHYQFCDACPQGYYTYINSLCLPTCYPHFNKSVDYGASLCDYPCADGEFLYEDGSCRSECGLTHSVRIEHGFHFCDSCTEASATCLMLIELQQAQTSSTLLSAFSNTIRITAVVRSILSSTNPSSFMLAIITDLLGYIQYLRVHYPPKLQYILDTGDDMSINLIPKIPDRLASRFLNHTLPTNFQRNQLSSSLTVNFWQSGISLLIVLIVTLLILAVGICSKKFRSLNSICKKIQGFLVWDFCLMMFVSKFNEIILYSSLTFRTLYRIYGFTVLDLIICLTLVLSMILALIRITHVLYHLDKNQTRHSSTTAVTNNRHSLPPANVLSKYGVLYEEYKQDTLAQKYFMLVIIGRIVLLPLIVSYLFDYPVFQVILLLLLNAFCFLYVVITRPHKHRVEFIKAIIEEFAMLIVSVCVLILAFMDSLHAEALSQRKTVGDIVIYTNTIFASLGAIFLIVKTLITSKDIVKGTWHEYKRRGHKISRLPIGIPDDQSVIERLERSREVPSVKTRRQNYSVRNAHMEDASVEFHSNFKPKPSERPMDDLNAGDISQPKIIESRLENNDERNRNKDSSPARRNKIRRVKKLKREPEN